MYILYSSPVCPHSRRVIALLEQAQLPYRANLVTRFANQLQRPEFVALNPNAQVPVFLDDNFSLFESNAILRYLCNYHELSQWYPEDASKRALVDQWLDWNQCQLSPLLPSFDIGPAPQSQQRLEDLLDLLAEHLWDKNYMCGAELSIADLSVASNIAQLEYVGVELELAPLKLWYQRMLALPGFYKTLTSMYEEEHASYASLV
ncbi:glutathione S-transferase family protein [Agaribacterium haliotis]|uniref:glutathione S-transferase family protein n=1 Tax=Agaribacterium haliotis TaxID=2013869 RepID=UPI000BB54C56|nr:glutathione S-transferase family protein [Agaribacterium haliotis]